MKASLKVVERENKRQKEWIRKLTADSERLQERGDKKARKLKAKKALLKEAERENIRQKERSDEQVSKLTAESASLVELTVNVENALRELIGELRGEKRKSQEEEENDDAKRAKLNE